MGFVAIFLLTIGAPSTKKCPVAPESDMAYSTAFVRRCVLNIMSARGEACRLHSRIIVFHAVCCVGIGIVVAFMGSILSLVGRVISCGMVGNSLSDVTVRL